MSHKNDDIVLAAMGLCVGPAFFWQGFQELRRKRLIEAIPTSQVHSMAMGTVKLQGVIDANDENILKDPIYGKEAVCYRIVIEEYRSSGRNNGWLSIYCDNTMHRDFWLVDETGRVLVNPKCAQNFYKQEFSYQPGLFHATNPEADNYIAANVGPRNGRPLRVTATILRPGDPFYVMGCAVPLEQQPPWHRRVAVNQESSDAAPEHVARAVIRPTPEGLFILAEESERAMVCKLSRTAFLFIFGGPILTVACLTYLCGRFGLIPHP